MSECQWGSRLIKRARSAFADLQARGQASAMAILTLGFSMGTVTGPALGGLLAEPCSVFGDGFPLCRPGQLFAVRCARARDCLCPRGHAVLPNRPVLCHLVVMLILCLHHTAMQPCTQTCQSLLPRRVWCHCLSLHGPVNLRMLNI